MQAVYGSHRAEIEVAVEMRKQFVVARGLPAQRLAERVGIDLDQEQAGLAEKKLPRSFGQLGSGREMDEAIARIVSAAAIEAQPFCLAPGGGRADFVDVAHLPD